MHPLRRPNNREGHSLAWRPAKQDRWNVLQAFEQHHHVLPRFPKGFYIDW